MKKIAAFRNPEKVEADSEKFKKSKKKRLRDFRKQLIEQVEETKEMKGMKNPEIKSELNLWIESIKSKRTEGLTENDIIEHKKREVRDKRRERANEYKNGGVVVEEKEEHTKKKSKSSISKSRLASFEK